MALTLLCSLGCAELPAEPVSAGEREGSTDVAPVGDGVDSPVDPAAPELAVEAHDDCRGELVEEPASLTWREVQAPEGDVVVRASELTLALTTELDHALDARLAMTVRADGDERVVSLGALRAEPGRSADLSVPFALAGLDLGALSHPAQVIVEARLYDGVSGAFLGSAHTPAVFLLLDPSGAPVAATEEALRVHFAAGASARQRQRGIDPRVRGYGRGRIARPEDLHGDPADVLARVEGGE